MRNKTTTDSPRILMFDIETAPNLSYTWEKWETNVIEHQRDWYMLSFAYKWLGDSKVHAYALPDFHGYKKDMENDHMLIQKLWDLFNEADIIIAHNGDEFDIKKTNARFLYHGMLPPKQYKTIDTKKVAKSNFKFDSNSLNDLGKQLGVGVKMDTGGFATWKGCMTGNLKAWERMVKYNKVDVELLESVYMKLRPWIKNFPITHVYDGSCYHCGSNHLQSRGHQVTRTATYKRYQCQDCGAWIKGDKVKE